MAPPTPVELPQEWFTRVRELPGVTAVHIPRALRDAHANIMTESIELLVAGGDNCHLEQGRSKLLLGPVPKGLHVRTELELRLRMWGDADFDALLVRHEAQAAASKGQSRKRNTNGCNRARQLVREGAYRKWVAALTGAMAALSPEEELRWARELLPNSTRDA